MCGINGIFNYRESAASIDRNALIRTRDHMIKRGPDGQGEWIDPNGRIGFGHRRLSIIDLSPTGAQPMVSADGQLVVTFNGEIYNYPAIRQSLEARGRIFASQSDTEVLLHLYAEKGEAMVQDLRGMFAFALWDRRRKRLLLVRDPYGIKPLYYADDGKTFQFASTVKALLAGDQVSKQPDSAGAVGFYIFGSVPEPYTTYRAIRSVPAGSTMVIDAAGAAEPKQFFSIPAVLGQAEHSRSLAADEVDHVCRAAFLDSVRHHLQADVPVGAFLSAGIDSCALVGLMRDAGQTEIRTVTLTFEDFVGTANDEAPLAEMVARYYGTEHTTRQVGSAEFARDLPDIFTAMDQPSVDGINTWFVAKVASELGLKVAISGVGGDELLGGYSTFTSVPHRMKRFGRIARMIGNNSLLDRASDATRMLGIHPKAAGLLRYSGSMGGAYLLQRGLFLPSELDCVFDDPGFVRDGLNRLDPIGHIGRMLQDGPTSTFGQIATLETSFYLQNQLLRDTDWASMAHSLEVRAPLVDSTLLARIAPVMAQTTRPSGKQLLAAAPTKALPAAITQRRKTGFSIPVEAWASSAVAEFRRPNKKTDKIWARSWARHVWKAARHPATI